MDGNDMDEFEEAHIVTSKTDGAIDLNFSIFEVDVNVYVCRKLFFQDLKDSFRSDDDILRQVRVDAPRLLLNVDGVPWNKAPPSLPKDKLPLCTQAIMGMAVQFISSESCVVAEQSPQSPLVTFIYANGEGMLAQKGLRVIPSNRRVRVCVHFGPNDSFVCIRYCSE